jgi:hypothetical protein
VRAESLFADLRSLDFSTAGFAEVRDIMVRYGGHAMQSELQPWFPDPGDPMVDAHGNVTFTGRPWPMCTPRGCTFRLQIMTRLPRIPLLDRTASFLYDSSLHRGAFVGCQSLEHIAVNLDRTVTDVHAVLLIAACAGLKARHVSPSLDAISEGSEVPVPSVVWTLHRIFPNPRLTSIQLSVSNFKPRISIESSTFSKRPCNLSFS